MSVYFTRGTENTREIQLLRAVLSEGQTGVAPLLDNLKYRARRSLVPQILGRSVRRGWAFDRYDQRDQRWWPQGISISDEAGAQEYLGDTQGTPRRIAIISWYSRKVGGVKQGSRLTFLDLDSLQYRHVLLVDPRLDEDGQLVLDPLRIHAGGVAWWGPWLHVSGTARGFATLHLEDIMQVPGDNDRPEDFGISQGRLHSYGHHHVLPVRYWWRGKAEGTGEPLRYSFFSLDRHSHPPQMLVGEYGKGSQSTRLASIPFDPHTRLPMVDADGFAPVGGMHDGGVIQMQGVARSEGVHIVSSSRGPWMPGSLFTGSPGDLQEHRWAMPMGPEDLGWGPAPTALWTVTEHPRRRWICEMKSPIHG